MDTHVVIRTRWAVIGTAIAATLGAVGLAGNDRASADITVGDRNVVVPANCRLFDTRPEFNVGPRSTPIGPAETITVSAIGSNGNCSGDDAIPVDAAGLVLNVTAVNATAPTFLTVWGPGEQPLTSSLNPAPGQPPTPNGVTVELSDAGDFNMFNAAGSVDVIIDVVGVSIPHLHDDRYYQKDEIDAMLAPDNPVIVPAAAFHPTSASSAADRFRGTYNFDDPAGDCAVAPVELPVGRSLSSVDTMYLSAETASLQISLTGVPHTPGADASLPGLHSPFDTAFFPVSPQEPIREVNAGRWYPTDLSPVEPDTHYTFTICVRGSVSLVSVQFNVSTD